MNKEFYIFPVKRLALIFQSRLLLGAGGCPFFGRGRGRGQDAETINIRNSTWLSLQLVRKLARGRELAAD